MSRILLSFSGNRLANNTKFNFFPFYEGLMNALVRNGNDVYYMIVNEFVQSYNSRLNQISSLLNQSKLDEYVKEQDFDLVIAFNNALYDGYIQQSNIPYVVWGVDPLSVYADKEKLKHDQKRYIFAGNCEDDYCNIKDYFGPSKLEILRFATDIHTEKVKQDYPISFVGTLWKSSEKELLRKGMSPSELKKIIELLRLNTNFTVDEIKRRLHIQHTLLEETSIFGLLQGIATTDRVAVLSALTDLGLHAYGMSEIWQNLADTNLALACAYDSKSIYDLRSTQDLFNRSKISFNMSHIHARGEGFSFRVMDSMASNACLVTDYKLCYKRLFGKYVDLPTFEYGNPQDARKVCEYLLNHEDERADIVKASQKAINAEYRFEHRFKQIESIANVKLFHNNQGKLLQICASDFLKETPKTVSQVVNPQQTVVDQKKTTLLKKILKFPKKLRIKRFNCIYKQYFLPFFIQLPTSMETGFNFVDRRFRDVLYHINNYLTSANYNSYHHKINIDTYIAKVSRGQMQKNSNGKIRVVFLFQEASYWASMKTLYETLKKTENFEVFVVAIPVLSPPNFNQLELKDENIKFLKDNNIEYIDARCANGTMFDIYNLKPDYVFVQIHFDRQRCLEYKTNIMRFYTKVCLIPHAFLLSKSDNKELIYQQDYFKIFVPNQYHADELSSVIHRNDNIEITGYPRFDLYNSSVADSPIWKIHKKKKSGMKRIIWSPHWWAYGHNRELANGVLNLWDYFYNYVQVHNDVELIVKPHPNLFNGLTQSGYITESKANSIIAAMNDLPNAQVYMGGDYIDLFKTADLIVNNSISFLAEWLPSEKPMIFFDTERKFELNEMAEQILEVYYHASSITALDKQINDILYKQQDPMKYQRINCCKKLNLKTDNVAEKIKESLIQHVNDSY